MLHLITRLGQFAGAALIVIVLAFAGAVIFSLLARAIVSLSGVPA